MWNSLRLPVAAAALVGGAALLAGPLQAQEAGPAPTVLVEKTIPLAEAFPEAAAAKGRTFRARKIVLQPGARTELVDHTGRPAITYVTAGEVREHRTGADPITHRRGAATMDRSGVSHYWQNVSASPAELLVVEIVPPGQ